MARVAANEGAFDNERELDLVWQVAEGWGDTDVERLRRLRAHSGRVAGNRPCLHGNCRWSHHVRQDGTLPVSVAASVGMDPGWWAAVRQPVMSELLARARWLVSGGPYEHPCEGTPVTWGRDADHIYALRRGLVRLRCGGTLNHGYAFASEVRR